MIVIPAIDLKDGQCVRLRQGEMDDATVFSDDPLATARHWVEQGTKRLHLVDLNGAFAGQPVNADAVRSWWNRESGRFDSKSRYLAGFHVDSKGVNATLRTGNQDQRAAAALELALVRPKLKLFPHRAPALVQMRVLERR